MLLTEGSTHSYEGILYFKNVARLRDSHVNVISFTPLRKARTFLRHFPQKSQTLSPIMRYIFNTISYKSKNNLGKYG